MTAPQGAQPAKAKKQKKERTVLEPVVDNGHPGNSKFARALGSPDFQTREKGLQALTRWMVRKPELREEDMMKIWKGLFYCFWHSDKAPVQMELAERLAAILTQLGEEPAFRFFRAFTTTIRREWFGIDRLRLDKFLMLIRKFLRAALGCLQASKWRPDLVSRYADYLHHHLACPVDTLSAAGVAYHVADILLDELRGAADGRAVPGAAVAALLAPFCEALRAGEQAALHRLSEGLFDSLLSEVAEPTDDSPYLSQLNLAALSASLFEAGARQDTRSKNRQVLYDLSGALERAQRKRQRVSAGAEAGTSSQPAANGAAAASKSKKHAAAAAQQAATASGAQADEAVPAGGEAAAGPAGPKAKRKRTSAAPAPDQPGVSPAAAAPAPEQASEEDGAATPKKVSLKRKKQHADGAVTPEAARGSQPKAVKGGEQAASPAAGKGAAGAHDGGAPKAKEPTSGQKAALRAAVGKAGQQEAETAPAPVAPKSALKKPKRQAADEDAPAAAPGPAAEQATGSGKRSAPGSAAKAAQPHANGHAEESSTPVRTQGKSGKAMGATTAKKNRVVINLKKNLYFEHGGPVPDPEIRTPPTSRSKGGILKKGSKSCPPKVSHTTDPTAEKQQRPGSAARVVPSKARRATAALFFG